MNYRKGIKILKEKPYVKCSSDTISSAFSGLRIPVIVSVVLILITGFIVYGNTFANKFIFDDDWIVVNNNAIKSFNNVGAIFTHGLSHFAGGEKGLGGNFFRPIQTLTCMIDYRFWKLNPLGYHLTNTLLHVIVSLLLCYFLRLITKNSLVSTIAALLYLVHPVHTEAVAYISGRADSIAAVFFLLMAVFQYKYWTSDRFKKAYYALLLISFLFALLGKELAVVFPFLLIFFEYCLKDEKKYSWISILFYVPIFLMIIVWFLFKNTIVKTEAMVAMQTSLWSRLTIAPRAIADYIRLSFVPINLHMEYKFPFPGSLFQPGYFEPFLGMLLFFPFVFYTWKKGRADINFRIIFLGFGWFLIALFPYLNIAFQVNAPFAEHWLYIPEMGLLLGVIYLVFYSIRNNIAAQKVVIVLCGIALCAFSYLTMRQNTVWKDGMHFYSYTIQHSPYSSKAYGGLAGEYAKQGDLDKARSLLEKALEVDPNDIQAAEDLRTLAGR